jgi:hypothetical protein
MHPITWMFYPALAAMAQYRIAHGSFRRPLQKCNMRIRHADGAAFLETMKAVHHESRGALCFG